MKNLFFFGLTICLACCLNTSWAQNTFPTNGNVGIGTTSPNTKLSTIGYVRAAYDVAETEYTEIWHGGGNGFINTVGDGNLDFRHDGSNKMTLTPTGRLGIGTTSPNTTFSSIGVVRAAHDNAETEYTEIDHGGSHGYINTVGDGNLDFRHDGSTKMSLSSSGNLGIGSTTPDYKLDVNGTARAKEIRVQTGWSDYVFYDDYDLPTLHEEEQHIEVNGHLLGFEAEADMEGEVQLGNVTKRQQAKIEELMLHVIAINKRLEKVEAENVSLKEELKDQH